jgi:hypothetical protein
MPDSSLKIREVVCALCMDPTNAEFGPKCRSCKAFHHADCWIDFGGCTAFGCAESPDMKNFQSNGEVQE